MDVAIIDYKLSNLHSVQSACKKVGMSSVITSDAGKIMDAKIAILPGVGSFGEAMTQLIDSKMDECIYKFIESGKIFVGICLGLQVLFEKSEEFGSYRGLGIIKGTVKKFQFSKDKNTKYPVPQIGWNKIQRKGVQWSNSPLCENNDNDFMYFIHSYYVVPEDEKVILSTTTYGNQEFCSSVQQNNIFASQFHPEKSGKVGLKIYQSIKSKI